APSSRPACWVAAKKRRGRALAQGGPVFVLQDRPASSAVENGLPAPSWFFFAAAAGQSFPLRHPGGKKTDRQKQLAHQAAGKRLSLPAGRGTGYPPEVARGIGCFRKVFWLASTEPGPCLRLTTAHWRRFRMRTAPSGLPREWAPPDYRARRPAGPQPSIPPVADVAPGGPRPFSGTLLRERNPPRGCWWRGPSATYAQASRPRRKAAAPPPPRVFGHSQQGRGDSGGRGW
ncbi:unnamed protein product, partial [Amoebophrya sp. A120]